MYFISCKSHRTSALLTLWWLVHTQFVKSFGTCCFATKVARWIESVQQPCQLFRKLIVAFLICSLITYELPMFLNLFIYLNIGDVVWAKLRRKNLNTSAMMGPTEQCQGGWGDWGCRLGVPEMRRDRLAVMPWLRKFGDELPGLLLDSEACSFDSLKAEVMQRDSIGSFLFLPTSGCWSKASNEMFWPLMLGNLCGTIRWSFLLRVQLLLDSLDSGGWTRVIGSLCTN